MMRPPKKLRRSPAQEWKEALVPLLKQIESSNIFITGVKRIVVDGQELVAVEATVTMYNYQSVAISALINVDKD